MALNSRSPKARLPMGLRDPISPGSTAIVGCSCLPTTRMPTITRSRQPFRVAGERDTSRARIHSPDPRMPPRAAPQLSILHLTMRAVLPLEVASVDLENVYAPWKYPFPQRRERVVWNE